MSSDHRPLYHSAQMAEKLSHVKNDFLAVCVYADIVFVAQIITLGMFSFSKIKVS